MNQEVEKQTKKIHTYYISLFVILITFLCVTGYYLYKAFTINAHYDYLVEQVETLNKTLLAQQSVKSKDVMTTFSLFQGQLDAFKTDWQMQLNVFTAVVGVFTIVLPIFNYVFLQKEQIRSFWIKAGDTLEEFEARKDAAIAELNSANELLVEDAYKKINAKVDVLASNALKIGDIAPKQNCEYKDDESMILSILLQAKDNYNRGNYQEAESLCTKAIRMDSHNMEALYMRGAVRLQLQKLDEAFLDYSKVIKLIPKGTEAYFFRGNIESELGRLENAIGDYDKAIELNQEYVDAYLRRGNVKFKLQEYKDAIEDYSKAIELDPKYTDAYFNRGLAKAKLGKRWDAIEDYSKAIELDPKYTDAYFNRGLNRAYLEKEQEALEDYNKVIELNPEHAPAYHNRGLVKAVLSDKQGALKDYDKAIELDPEYASAYYHRSLIEMDLGKGKEGIKDYNKAIELDPEYKPYYKG